MKANVTDFQLHVFKITLTLMHTSEKESLENYLGVRLVCMLQKQTKTHTPQKIENVIQKTVKVKSLSCVRLSATPWTAARQAPLSMGFSRQEYWRGLLPFPSPGKLGVPHGRQLLYHLSHQESPFFWETTCTLYISHELTAE